MSCGEGDAPAHGRDRLAQRAFQFLDPLRQNGGGRLGGVGGLALLLQGGENALNGGASLVALALQALDLALGLLRALLPAARQGGGFEGRDPLARILELRSQADDIGLGRGGAELGIVDGGQGRANVVGIDEDAVIGKQFRERDERLPLRFGQHRLIPGEDSMIGQTSRRRRDVERGGCECVMLLWLVSVSHRRRHG